MPTLLYSFDFCFSKTLKSLTIARLLILVFIVLVYTFARQVFAVLPPRHGYFLGCVLCFDNSWGAIECKKSREQRCNEQAIKIFISRGFQEKEAFVDDIWEFQVSMVFSMLMYGGNCVIWERISG